MISTIRIGKSYRGFTLVEMTIVIVILGIVMAIAAPSFNTMTLNQRVKSGVADLQASMFYARSEALKRGGNVDVLPVAAGDWTQGWKVSVAGTTLRQESTLAGKLKIDVDTTATTNVTFRGDGRRVTGGPAFIRLSILGNNNVAARCIKFSLSGIPRVVIDKDTIAANGC